MFWSFFYLLYMLLIVFVFLITAIVGGYGGQPLLGLIVFLILFAGLIKFNSTFFSIFYELEKFFNIDDSPVEDKPEENNNPS